MSDSSGKEIGVYILQNSFTMETYIGSGVIEDRLYDHQHKLSKGEHKNKKLQEAYNRDPNFEAVAVPLECRDLAFDVEQAMIDKFKGSPLLLNMCMNARSGGAPGRIISEETREKMRQSQLGKIISEEAKLKMSIARAGVARPEHSTKMMGHVVSEETRKKIRLANTGKVRTDETCEKIRAVTLGKLHTEESKCKMSETRTGVSRLTIQVNGKVYEGIQKVVDEYNLPQSTVSKRLSNDNFPTGYVSLKKMISNLPE